MDSNESTLKLVKLRGMQHRALALLLCMVGLYAGCHLGVSRWPALSWVNAFAEAAIVGGLADWFAVVALFRHPLGIPIPHTAILPRRKQHIAKTVAAFVVENFLAREVLLRRMANFDFVAYAGAWGCREADFLAKNVAALLPRLLDSLDKAEVAAVLHRHIVRQAANIPLAPFAGRLLGVLTAGGRHEVLLDEGLRMAGQLLAEHRGSIEDAIRREVPLPDYLLLPRVLSLDHIKRSIATWVAQKLVDRVHLLLTEAASSREHPVRQRFTERVERLVEELQVSPEYIRKGEELKQELLSSPLLLESIEGAWIGLVQYAKGQVESGGGSVVEGIGVAVLSLVRALEEDPVLGARLNDGLKGAACEWVEKHRPQFEGAIRETIESWDAAELSRKLELEVGADLQFVRMNGTLIGGSVGLLLHLCSKLLG
jgi:uncharacterized membrane-anchored protein YjiN (DUF445 family)